MDFTAYLPVGDTMSKCVAGCADVMAEGTPCMAWPYPALHEPGIPNRVELQP